MVAPARRVELVLREIGGLDPQQIAAVVGRSEDAVVLAIYAARRSRENRLDK